MEDLLTKITNEWMIFDENAKAQLVKNNKAVGARARKASLALTELLKEFRKVSIEEGKK